MCVQIFRIIYMNDNVRTSTVTVHCDTLLYSIVGAKQAVLCHGFIDIVHKYPQFLKYIYVYCPQYNV